MPIAHQVDGQRYTAESEIRHHVCHERAKDEGHTLSISPVLAS